MLPVMHIFNNHNKLKSQPQSEYRLCGANMDTARTMVEGGRQRPGSRTAGSYDKGDDYLWGCSGGQLLHCRGSESGGAAS